MTTRSTDTYTSLITSTHANKPKFMAMLAQLTEPFVKIQQCMDLMTQIFDIDNPPVGNQLDILGQWIGVSRNLTIPISGINFSWDDPSLGWDTAMATWKDPSNPTYVSSLPDANYLTLLRARIAANNWDGTTEGAYTIWNLLFPQFNLILQDNQDMSFLFGVQGAVPDLITIALITGGYLNLKPEGVQITNYIIPKDANPFFGWDLENNFAQGWDEGSWGSIVTS